MAQATLKAAALVGLLVVPFRAATWCSPSALAASKDGRTLYAACATANRVEVVDTTQRKVVRAFPVPAPPSGLALAPDESRLYVTCAAPASTIRVIPLKPGSRGGSIRAGHTAEAPLLSPDGKRLYVPNRFSNDVSVIDTAARKEIGRVQVVREPMGAALSRDGKLLFVINSVPAGRADVEYVAAEISLIDTGSLKPAGRIVLPNGSAELRGIAVSPDGALAGVTHLLARYYLPTTQVDRGWMETNALSVIDVPGRKLLATVLLDEIDQGAANPWAVSWTGDGKRIVVTHAGTHEVSLIEAGALVEKVRGATRETSDDLAFLVGLRQRIKLAGNGPRALVLVGRRAYVAGYFSDTLEEIDLEQPAAAAFLRLSSAPMTTVRRGEMLFNDGSICFQGWQSCASCHSPDARVDGLNWDLLNDGIGNPKNVKSLLLSHRTPPAMSQGVRENAEEAVRAGIRHILFAQRPGHEAAAIDEFLKSLQPVPSPWLVKGKPSAAAKRGEKLFMDGCASCHPVGLYTDLKAYDVGTGGRFDTPTLVEIWRTAPYLHNGSAPTLREVLTDQHGRTSRLTPRQLDDLLAYLLIR
ncbi:MAG: c-type cytochrome [Acidobacteriota bacterium]